MTATRSSTGSSVPSAAPVRLRGFARSTGSDARVVGPLDREAVSGLLADAGRGGVLARGSGCSYGDAAQNAGGTVVTSVLPSSGGARVVLGADEHGPLVRAVASATFAEILSATVPAGLVLPVLPGTARLTVGGAIAADVHGKNQRHDGTVARWVRDLTLVDGTGTVQVLDERSTPDRFRATLGGMGLTGVVTEATLRLQPLRSTRLRVESTRAGDLDALLAEMDASTHHYSVAWVDASARGAALGRGMVEGADHLAEPLPDERAGLAYAPSWAPPVPPSPVAPVTTWTARALNAARFHAAKAHDVQLVGLPAFFHRLDALDGWNRALGPQGFVQYQLSVPDGEERLLAVALETLHREGVPCFLGTLKRFGPASGALLSFPRPGWSIALDLPRGRGRAATRLDAVLDGLDRQVADAGGRVYLCKDGRLSRDAFERMYADALPHWRAVRAELDPHERLGSDLGRRLGLCR